MAMAIARQRGLPPRCPSELALSRTDISLSTYFSVCKQIILFAIYKCTSRIANDQRLTVLQKRPILLVRTPPSRTARKEDRIGNRSGHGPPVLSTAYPMVAHPNHDMEMKRTFQGGSPKAKGNQMYCVGREEARRRKGIGYLYLGHCHAVGTQGRIPR